MADTPNNTYFGIVAPGDIVARLHDALEVTYEGWPLLSDAAAEIERLRHQVDDLRRCLEDDQFEIQLLREAGNWLAEALLDLTDMRPEEHAAIATWTEARQ